MMEVAEDWIMILVVAAVSGGDVSVTTDRVQFEERRACVAAAEALRDQSGVTTVNGVEVLLRYEASCVGQESGRVFFD